MKTMNKYKTITSSHCGMYLCVYCTAVCVGYDIDLSHRSIRVGTLISSVEDDIQ